MFQKKHGLFHETVHCKDTAEIETEGPERHVLSKQVSICEEIRSLGTHSMAFLSHLQACYVCSPPPPISPNFNSPAGVMLIKPFFHRFVTNSLLSAGEWKPVKETFPRCPLDSNHNNNKKLPGEQPTHARTNKTPGSPLL